MYGPKCAHVRGLPSLLPEAELLAGGLVDYALGAEPYTGAFVIAWEDDAKKRKDLSYFKMGDGPYYTFYTPYHLPHIQIASTITRAVLFHDPTIAPMGAPVCEVAAAAKRDLNAGEVLDGIGAFMIYGIIENAEPFAAANLLPVGVAEGCRLLRPVAKDSFITYDDVELPKSRLCDALRREQLRLQGGKSIGTLPRVFRASQDSGQQESRSFEQ
jgi:predicted homoserine dehydrogenase-like protein